MANGVQADVDKPIALILLVGMVTSIILMLIGVGTLVAQPQHERVHLLQPLPAMRAALAMHPNGWLSLGVLVLILTPVARVLMAIGSFAWIRDWKYAAVSLVVLAAMTAALLLGK